MTKKKENLQNLILNGCPLGHDFINSHCPVSDAKKIPARNLAHYVDSLSEEQINNIFEYHQDCSSFFQVEYCA
ncbi:MAG: hypothetical protein KKG47_08250 [Proteobacteria bacterium]|nr:hypothetical protein [Pseudomonadota bacterium]MBU1739326.1 hypothetical protein [Pseudomonadota bacterium]